MYNIIIFGTGKTRKVVETGLNEKINVIAYCDNDTSKWNKILNGKKIISPDQLKKIEYDYIIIASQYNESIYRQLIELDIDSKKIFEFFKYVNTSSNGILENINRLLLPENEDVKTLITGISYAARGIDTSQFSEKAYNMACGSQDLYYDYHIIKYLLENHKEHLKNVRNVIIGLCYYSFEYDMSLSAMQNRVCFYYEAIGLKHHGNERDASNEYRNEKLETAKTLFRHDDNGNLIVNWLYDKKGVYEISERIGKKAAIVDGNKDYPETVKENTEILIDYLNLLKENKIKPIILNFPLTKYYSANFPQKLKSQFYSILKNIRENHEFTFLDYSENHDFSDEEFYDVSHLNSKGAKRFSRLINEIINKE